MSNRSWINPKKKHHVLASDESIHVPKKNPSNERTAIVFQEFGWLKQDCVRPYLSDLGKMREKIPNLAKSLKRTLMRGKFIHGVDSPRRTIPSALREINRIMPLRMRRTGD